MHIIAAVVSSWYYWFCLFTLFQKSLKKVSLMPVGEWCHSNATCFWNQTIVCNSIKKEMSWSRIRNVILSSRRYFLAAPSVKSLFYNCIGIWQEKNKPWQHLYPVIWESISHFKKKLDYKMNPGKHCWATMASWKISTKVMGFLNSNRLPICCLLNWI